MLSEKSNERTRPGRTSLRSNSKPRQENMNALEEQLASPNKDDEIDDDFADLIVNKTNSLHERRESNDNDNQMKMSELKQSMAANKADQYAVNSKPK